MVGDLETGHPGVSHTAYMLQSKKLAVELFRFFQVVHGYGPISDLFDVQQSHYFPLVSYGSRYLKLDSRWSNTAESGGISIIAAPA